MKKVIILVMLLLVNPAWGIRVLKPTDIVKGQPCGETFYCYTEEEQKKVLKDLELVDYFKELVKNKEERERDTEGYLRAQTEKVYKLEEEVKLLKEAVAKGDKQEKDLLIENIKLRQSLDNANARTRSAKKTNFLFGIVSGVGALLGGRSLGK